MSPTAGTPGALFGRYNVLCRWATGGMAEIFVARQTGAHGFDKLVALKLLRDELSNEPGFREMFFAEARTSALLSHPNIVQTFDVGENDGLVYMAMEFVNGESLSRVTRSIAGDEGDRVPRSLAVAVCREVANALHYAHTLTNLEGAPLHLVHRDVSPSNIMLTHDGTVKLLDFGIAKVSTAQVQTKAGTVKGKFAYLSPEQARAEPLDGRSDIFSLGVVLWQLLTGRRAFTAENEMALLHTITTTELEPPSAFVECDPELDAIVRKATCSDPDERFEDAHAFANALNGYLAKDDPGYGLEKHIRELMKTHFSKRRKQLAKVVAQAGDGSSALPGYGQSGLGVQSISQVSASTFSGDAFGPGQMTTPASFSNVGSFPSQSQVLQQQPKSQLVPLLILFVLLMAGGVAAYLLTRAPETRTIVITSEPGEAQVVVDGEPLGTTPVQLELTAGATRNIVVKRLGYKPYHQAVNADDGSASVHAILVRSDEAGTLVVKSEPPGAAVSVDGTPVAEQTPVVLTGLWVGAEHSVVVTLPGFAPHAQRVSFADTSNQDLDITLDPTSQGYLAATCTPDPCELHVDGKLVGTTPIINHPVVASHPVTAQLSQNGTVVVNEILTLSSGELRTLTHKDVSTTVAALEEPVPLIAAQPLVKDPKKRKVRRPSDSASAEEPEGDLVATLSVPEVKKETAPAPKETSAPVEPAAPIKETVPVVAARKQEEPPVTTPPVEAPKPTAKTPEPTKVELSVKVGSPRVNGVIDQNTVRDTVKGFESAFLSCYKKEFANQEFEGKVDLAFVITSSGSPRDVKLTGEGNAGLNSCWEKVVATTAYPRPTSSDATVKVTVRLNAR